MSPLWAGVALAASLNAAVPSPSLSPSPQPVSSLAPAAPQDAGAPARVTPNPFRNLLSNFATDARHLAAPDPIVVLAVGGAGALGAHNSDTRAFNWAAERQAAHPNPPLARIGNVYGDGFVQAGLAVAAWGFGRHRGDARYEALGADLIRAAFLNGVITQSLKIAIDRDRPDGGRHAFPSGHASASFATATVILRDRGVLASSPFFAAAALVPVARVRTLHHWVSDTVFGAAIGIASGLAVTHGGQGRWSVVPAKTPGGAALYVVRR